MLVTTITFLKFPVIKVGYALSQMQLAHNHLRNIEGLIDYKLLGSGSGNGFSVWPDWKVYSFLGIWKSTVYADRFFDKHNYFNSYCAKADKKFTVYLEAVKTKGTWGGSNPYKDALVDYDGGRIGVITRATIKPKYIPYFWSQVPKASRGVPTSNGHIFSKGVGETPLMYQATFSMWESKDLMYRYAYNNEDHIEMIRKTREKGWYSEEMFTEFNILRIQGELFLNS